MKRNIMTCIALMATLTAGLLTARQASAQAIEGNAASDSEKKVSPFSAEGRKAWKPEFTIRQYAGLVTSGPFLTGGVRISEKRTLGLALWQGHTYVDAVPGNFDAVYAGLYTRRYSRHGKKNVVAFYSDLTFGCSYIYQVSGSRYAEPDGDDYCGMDEKPGDMSLQIAWQPGIRFRIWRNLHIFLGPTISSYTLGAHLGVGF